MKLTKAALEAIDKTPIRMKIGVALNVGEASIRFKIRDNDENGDLTTLAVLNIISQETGLDLSDIVTDEKATA